MRSKWAGFKSAKYQLLDLGRPAIFLLPAKKLAKKTNGVSLKDDLHFFLLKNFGAFSASTIPNFGFWKDNANAVIYDKCIEYEVSFLGKGNIPRLLERLAKLAMTIGEDCIYFKAGQYTCLIYPKRQIQNA